MVKVWNCLRIGPAAESDTGFIPLLGDRKHPFLKEFVPRIKPRHLEKEHIGQYIIPQGLAGMTSYPIQIYPVSRTEKIGAHANPVVSAIRAHIHTDQRTAHDCRQVVN